MIKKDSRSITERGLEELDSALVNDGVVSIAAKIELLAYQTSLESEKRPDEVPINISLFSKGEFARVLEAMKESFKAGLCVSNLVAVAFEGERLGRIPLPQGKAGLATVSSVAINGALLKAGIRLDAKFGGLLQIRNHKPFRFTELIEYAGCSLDPAEIFIASKMTNVAEAASKGEGKILAGFYEFPAPCRPAVETILRKLERAGLNGLTMIGEASDPICEVPVRANKVGMIIQSGLNPVAAAAETGIEMVNHAMSGVIEFKELRSFWDLCVVAG